MAVKLRQRTLSDGTVSLYLDIYNKGRRKFEWLDIRLSGNRETDKAILQIANKIAAERALEIACFKYDFNPAKPHLDFYQYIDKIIRTKNPGNQHIYHLFLVHFKRYAGSTVQFCHLTSNFCSDFYSYLQSQLHLSQTTRSLYFIKLRTVVHQAIREGIILKDPTSQVILGHSEHYPRFLTLTELQSMVETDCSNSTVRNAFLFGCCTGLRISDIYRLKWSDLHQNRIEIVQLKTQRRLTIPLNKTAFSVLSAQSSNQEHIFNFPHFRTINRTLKRWAKAAGIDKPVTFHWSRHTFATLALSAGVDIYVVSKLLGHSKLATTSIYAQLIDKTREEAYNKLPQLSIPAEKKSD